MLDYVFDGLNQEQYQVNDPANPQNEYGRAKYAGEDCSINFFEILYYPNVLGIWGNLEITLSTQCVDWQKAILN